MKYYVRHNINKSVRFFRILLIFGCVFVIFGSVALFGFFFKKNIAVDTYYYLLYLKDEDIGTEAGAFDCFLSGGAGVVFSDKRKDYIIMAAYPDLTAAGKVAEREDAGIIKVGISDIKASVFRGENYYMQIKNNVNILKQCISVAYDTANAMETGGITHYAAKYNLLSLAGILKSLVSDNIHSDFKEMNDLILECISVADMDFAKNINSGEVRRMQVGLIFSLLSFEKKFIVEKII